jgi:hypothetical protein
MPVKGLMTKLKDGRDAVEIVEDDEPNYKEYVKQYKVFSNGRGGVYQVIDNDFEKDYNITDDQVSPI